MSLMCKIFGHKTREKFYTYSSDHMWRYTNYRHFNHCIRCGAKNGQ